MPRSQCSWRPLSCTPRGSVIVDATEQNAQELQPPRIFFLSPLLPLQLKHDDQLLRGAFRGFPTAAAGQLPTGAHRGATRRPGETSRAGEEAPLPAERR